MADHAVTLSSLYNPINAWQTRILKLHPEEPHEALYADLVVADIIHLPGIVLHDEQRRIEYQALSYTWGAPVFDHHININGKPRAITKSLHGALKCIQNRAKSTPGSAYIWADAICIDQSNDSEKSFQVQNMFTIFSKAHTVIAWLGEGDKCTSGAVQFLKDSETIRIVQLADSSPGSSDSESEIEVSDGEASSDIDENISDHYGSLDDRDEDAYDHQFDDRMSDLKCRLSRARDVERYITDKASVNVIHGLRDLVSRPWISRAWVQQEVFAGKRLEVHCGEETMTLGQFKSIWILLACISDPSDQSPNDTLTSPVRNLRILRHLHHSTELQTIHLDRQRAIQRYGQCKLDVSWDAPSVLSLDYDTRQRCSRPECILADLSGVQASNPRDYVYAIVSMTDCETAKIPMEASLYASPSPENFRIDYTLSTSQVFQLLARYLIRRDKSYELLAGHTPAEQNDLELPSWTPDWRTWSSHKGDTGDKLDSSLLYYRRLEGPWTCRGQWDVIHAQGIVGGIIRSRASGKFALEEISRPVRRMHRQTRQVRLLGKYQDDGLHCRISGIVQEGDTLANLYGKNSHDIEVVLRPRKAGGYTFVASFWTLRHPKNFQQVAELVVDAANDDHEEEDLPAHSTISSADADNDSNEHDEESDWESDYSNEEEEDVDNLQTFEIW